MGLLDGKVAIITGAGRGIGRAEAILFAREGAHVVVNDLGVERDGSGGSVAPARDVVAEIQAFHGEATPSFDDVATPAGSEKLVETAVAAYGQVDILVNNAGIIRDKSLLNTNQAQWDAVLAVHLTGTFLCTQAAARRMVARGEGGRIVNTTGIAGLQGNFGQASDSAAKAGVYGLTRTTAIELQKHRITANAIAPIARTRLTEDLPMFQGGMHHLSPEHVAPAALFLASDLCGDRSGHVLAVAGAQIYIYKLVQSGGRFKENEEPWTAQEIAQHWGAIAKG
jgi:NAD(P)-dependent dehydrogenase (short-subunit alcohol dehydrogenase family)